MTERYLIVGGAGYFGSRLAETLAADADVTITYRSETPARQSWIRRHTLNAVAFDSAGGSEIAVSGRFDAIINLAMPGAVEASRDEHAALEHAKAAASACIDLVDRGATSKLIHFSSFHVYGAAGRECYDESDVPAPAHPYGRVHLEVERRVLANRHALVLRPSNMVGAPAHGDLGDQRRLIFVDLCRQAAAGAIVLNNDGASHRDFLTFGDAIAAVRTLIANHPGEHRVFNLANGASIRLDELAEIIRGAASVERVSLGNARDDFRHPFRISTHRLRTLGWSPRGSLAQEAAQTVRFFREAQ